MKNIKTLPLIIIALMATLSFSNLFGLNISSACIFIGVAFFFINKAIEKQPMKGSGLDLKAIGANLKDRKIWIWLVLPIVTDAVCVIISKLFLPQYIEYETARAGAFVPVELSVSSVILFFVFALGEEIAWRAFFQNQLTKILPIIPTLLFSSLLFTLGHYKAGNTIIVVYGLIFTFINSILYGVIFHKTKNAWISTFSHFTANMFEVIVFILI
ncbi:CPBP family glutamic-type intramembrane protease [Clostridium swellfunianum]|uniref:CPBP family intramembrane glutamic endopeptidase n=1 Tax=Clostridium swellfunianum TaxID=1367462 RepID=UPI00202DB795|nr:CPBP family intramembrane glutamic endopeptidase [Clostridium swellfunianum]MCM0649369.1 CPBP family glutamic-type intramembrane protease [Clostridium swellfunianum]